MGGLVMATEFVRRAVVETRMRPHVIVMSSPDFDEDTRRTKRRSKRRRTCAWTSARGSWHRARWRAWEALRWNATWQFTIDWTGGYVRRLWTVARLEFRRPRGVHGGALRRPICRYSRKITEEIPRHRFGLLQDHDQCHCPPAAALIDAVYGAGVEIRHLACCCWRCGCVPV